MDESNISGRPYQDKHTPFLERHTLHLEAGCRSTGQFRRDLQFLRRFGTNSKGEACQQNRQTYHATKLKGMEMLGGYGKGSVKITLKISINDTFCKQYSQRDGASKIDT